MLILPQELASCILELLAYLCMPNERVPHLAEAHLAELSKSMCSVYAGPEHGSLCKSSRA